MNNGLLGWPGSRKVLQQMCATNNTGVNRKFFTSSTTWVVPAGVTRIRASALGGGGGGTGGNSAATCSGGGGGGGLFLRGDLNVTPGEMLTITVGAGGAGGVGQYGGYPAGVGTPGGVSQIVQAGRVVIAAFGGFGGAQYSNPAPDQTGYYFDGIPLAVVPGKGGGAGSSPDTYGGSGGGGGGLSARNTAGTAYAANSASGSGSMGAVTPGARLGAAGIASLLGLPESGSGGGSSAGVGNAGAQGSGGGGAGADATGGNGGAGFVLVEY
ncbi:MAG: glycine-rich domain-containing protein [Sulfuricellaceae bacterium]